MKSIQSKLSLLILLLCALASWANDPRLHVKPVMIGKDTAASSNASGILYKGLFYFARDDGTNGVQLWATDGSSAGTHMVKLINPTGSAYPSNFAIANNKLFFFADDGVHGSELWVTDGTELGTKFLHEFFAGSIGGSMERATELNGWLYFLASDDSSHARYRLYRSNGTSDGTNWVSFYVAGSTVNLFGTPLVAVNNRYLVFQGYSVADKKSFLYTVKNGQSYYQMSPAGGDDDGFYGVTAIPGTDSVVYVAKDASGLPTLYGFVSGPVTSSSWVYNNPAIPNGQVQYYSADIRFLNGGFVVNAGDDQSSNLQPWFYPSRAASAIPFLLKTLNPKSTSSHAYPDDRIIYKNQLFFGAMSVDSLGHNVDSAGYLISHMFVTDGTVAGTKDACPTQALSIATMGASGLATSVVELNGLALFIGGVDTSGSELYTYDGTNCLFGYSFLPGHSGGAMYGIYSNNTDAYMFVYTSNSFVTQLFHLTRNLAPVMSTVSTQNAKEDTSLTFNVTVSDTDDPLSSTQIHISAANPSLIAANGLSVTGTGATRVVTIHPAAATFGSTTITLVATDGVDSTTQTFTLNIAMVNHAPSFTALSDSIHVNEDDPAYNATWATNLNRGLPNESAQQLSFTVVNDHPSIFSVQPAISSAGALSFTLAPDSNGVAHLSVVLKDDGGVTYNGIDSSAAKTFVIAVAAVNDPPYFVKGDTAIASYAIGSPVQAILVARDKEQQTLNFNVLSVRASLLTSITDSSLTVTWMPTNDADTISVEVVDALGAKDTIKVIAVAGGASAILPPFLASSGTPLMEYSHGILWIRTSEAWSGRVSALDAQGRVIAAREISVGKGECAIAWPELGAFAFVKANQK